jgi:catechol 2,3-dioxygenase
MPLPAPNLYPPFHIVRLSHVELHVTDLARSRAFWVDTLGLQVTHEDDELITLRAMEERNHHCVILRRADRPSAGHLAFKVYSEDDLDKAHAWLTAQGHAVEWVERPWQDRTLRTRDPQGVPLEFYATMERLAPIHQKYALYTGVKPLRIDHFNCFSTDVDASVAFYNDIGFRVTEYTEDEETKRLWAAWMHRKGGVHDLMSTTGYLANIERGPGRHGISNAFFLYIRDPDGHRVEIYCSDYLTIDPDHEPIRWDLKDPQRQTLWGAPAPKSWFEEGSAFADTEIGEPTLAAKPIVAP